MLETINKNSCAYGGVLCALASPDSNTNMREVCFKDEVSFTYTKGKLPLETGSIGKPILDRTDNVGMRSGKGLLTIIRSTEGYRLK